MAPPAARRHTGGMKVFLVEDSPAIVDRLTALLGAAAEVEVVGHAATADAAIAAIPSTRPDIVLLDLTLADGSTGFDVLRALHGRLPGVAFYMLSNFSADPYRNLAQRLGAKGFFDKTKDFERVRELVANPDRSAKGGASCLQSSC